MKLFRSEKRIAKKYGGGLSRNFKTKTEIDMGAWNYFRYHNILMKIDEYIFMCNNLEKSAVRPLYSSMITLFQNIDKLFSENVSKEYIKLFSDSLNAIEKWEGDVVKRTSFPKEVVNKLNNIHIKLVTSMQIMGLGDRTYSPNTTDSRVYSEIVG